MNSAKVYAIENRLARVVRAPGGKTIAEALKSAEARIESVRERCVASLVGKAEQLSAHAEAARRDPENPNFDRIYDAANAIFGVAGAYGLDALAEAACSLCDLADRFRGGESVNWSAIGVHVDGIRLLASSSEGAEVILAGLRRVRARFIQKI